MQGTRLLRAAAALALAAAAPAADAGDAAVGRALFIGERPLQAGGPPCGACHALGGQGAAFAASLGPDLSQSLEDPQAAEAILEALPFPSMAPLYARRPLSPEERAALLVAPGRQPAAEQGRIAAWAVGLAAACLAALGLVARRRPGPVRAGFLARASRGEGRAR
jgi:cytochrome c peroxidase